MGYTSGAQQMAEKRIGISGPHPAQTVAPAGHRCQPESPLQRSRLPGGRAASTNRRYAMTDIALRRITESGIFAWPWATAHGLAIVVGAEGGGGGGGGALCLEGLNLFGAAGGGGGDGGASTTIRAGEEIYRAAGGSGGDGGAGGGLVDGEPVKGKNGKGCHYGDGGAGGHGAVAPPAEGRLASNGSDGGKGFPGETRIVELHGLSKGDRFEIEIGQGGDGGGGGDGYEQGDAGVRGNGGSVLFVPLFAKKGEN